MIYKAKEGSKAKLLVLSCLHITQSQTIGEYSKN